MKILFVTDSMCIRTYKELSALIDRGVEVSCVSAVVGTGFNFYKTCYVYWYGDDARKPRTKEHFKAQLINAIANEKPDIIHCHNEPDWIAEETVKIAHPLNIKTVWDLHDIESARWQTIPLQEQRIFNKIDGIITPSIGISNWVGEIHPYFAKPIVEIYSCFGNPLEMTKFIKDLPEPQISIKDKTPNSLIYMGGLYLPKPNDPPGKIVNFRDLRYIFSALTKEGFQVHALAGNCNIGERRTDLMGYLDCGVIMDISVDPVNIIYAMNQYEFGFVGFPIYGVPLCNKAMPNKFFDYMTSLVIPIVVNCDEVGKIVEDNQIGFWIKNESDFFKQGGLRWILNCDKPAYQERIKAFRERYYMNRQMDKLLDFYKKV